MERIKCFEPIADENAQMLILGSMPSVKSLEKAQFYAHPQNQFWKFMFHIFGQEYTTDYEIKKRLMLENNIALWDVIAECEREGSMDSDIKNAIPNDISGLLKKCGKIKHIFCNGQTAYKYFKRFIITDIPCVCLPSTSPANARISYDEKLKIWKENIMFFYKNT